MFKNIETGKCLNVLMLFLSFTTSLSFIYKLFNGKRFASFVAAIAIAFNPISAVQIFSGFVDGLLASTFTVYAILLTDYFLFNQKKSLYQAILILPFLINLKFTGLVYSVIFTTLLIAFYILYKKNIPKKLILLTIISGLFSLAVIGFNPYVSNVVEKKNPFYPVYQPRSPNIISKMACPDFISKNRFCKFIISTFSVHDKSEYMKPVLSMPFSTLEPAPGIEARFAGFGPLFSGVFIIALLQLFLLRDGVFCILVLIIAATIFSTSACWWARLAPQTWLVVGLIELGIYYRLRKSWLKCFVLAVLVTMIANTSLVFTKIVLKQTRMTKQFHKDIDIVKRENFSIEINDNAKNHFKFYNKRKVIDTAGENITIVKNCKIKSKNQIFNICTE
ncbi:MAG: hypothetical protein P9M03_00115 [Candidatus Theseobacter exili]|nr:hypothetical protein [Candidatus Theseobacter exili]